VKLEDILAEHKKSEIGASFDTNYRVIKRCRFDCPACAQERLVKWLKEIGIGEGPVDSDPIWCKFPWAYWLALRQEVLGE